MLVQSLNFESRTAYSLNVTVMDGGDPIFSDSALVNISVQDINDNTPLFNASSYTAEVFEGNYTTAPLRIVTVRHTQYVKGNDIMQSPISLPFLFSSLSPFSLFLFPLLPPSSLLSYYPPLLSPSTSSTSSTSPLLLLPLPSLHPGWCLRC